MNKYLSTLTLAAILSGMTTINAKDVWLDELDLSAMSSGYAKPQAKKSLDGRPISINKKIHLRGVGTHADSRMVIKLDGKARGFHAVVGVDDEANLSATVRFTVIADGEMLFDSGVLRLFQSKTVDVDLTGKKFLTLVIDGGGDGITADHADWADARISYDGEKPAAYLSKTRWTIEGDGSIRWTIKNDPLALGHHDHIEMSGRYISMIVRYGIEPDGSLKLGRHLVWPMLRILPNDTHGNLARDFEGALLPEIRVDGQPLGRERPISVTHRGLMGIRSEVGDGLVLTRVLFPCMQKPAAVERFTMENVGDTARQVSLKGFKNEHRTEADKGVDGAYVMTSESTGDTEVKLAPGKSLHFSVVHSARRASAQPLRLDAAEELQTRADYIAGLDRRLEFECPDPVLNRTYAFAKIRAAESIYKTKGGLMHGPGGGRYYAAIWANDQAEYVNPLFAYLGDPDGRESAENAFRHFARFMNDEWKPIPSSIVAEGDSIWNGVGDRGDAAMIAYGATRYALAKGDKDTAEKLWPLIEWCLEFCRRKTNANGVVESDCDELEHRFPAGKANLCTSSLAYDALVSAAALGRDLGKPETQIKRYQQEAEALRKAIESHFGANVEGFETYRYYEGNEVLRAWICIPLTVGINDRREGTIKALFSERLWTDDGLATEAGKNTFWDRSTLYGLRGVFATGETAKGIEYLKKYSTRRLLGDHVPYAVEAYPEGNQRHLSAESGLYIRLVVEGMFGFHPTGLRSFTCQPRLPEGWPSMELRNIDAFGTSIDIKVTAKGAGKHILVKAGGKTVVSRPYDEKAPVQINLIR
ncbi:MAG: NPCBM/NEW2 domain-containing protein [Akkermansiaceae bacterium]|nr:NPCBM/NEW2 domain-containing protein [Akkermansiaceae bacterium]